MTAFKASATWASVAVPVSKPVRVAVPVAAVQPVSGASEKAGRSTGQFFFDREPRRTHWLPGTRETRAERLRLWALCEEWTGARPGPESGSTS